MQDEIKQKAPIGATHYTDLDGVILYFFKSKYGFRQIKDNSISFFDNGIQVNEIFPIGVK